MKKINSSILALSLLAFPFVGAAFAQEDEQVTVNLSDLSAEIATALNVSAEDVPDSVMLSLDAAAEACGVDAADLSAGTSCNALLVTSDLTLAIEAETDDGELGGSANPNSASEFAPGQQEGPANEFAPGQQEGPANESAPGQLKKDTEED